MNEKAQQGYDDEKRDTLNSALMGSDSQEGQDYREGIRTARRERRDAEQLAAAPEELKHAVRDTQDLHEIQRLAGERPPADKPIPHVAPPAQLDLF